MSDYSKMERRVLSAAQAAADNLRSTAARLQAAIESEDWESMSEIQLSQTSWTLDAVRGAAWAVMRVRSGT